MRISKSSTIPVPYGLTAGQLIKILEQMPELALIRVGTTPGDRPWESATHRLELTWTEEV